MACKTFHQGKYYVTFKRGFEDFKKDITVTVDKVFESDSLKISLSDEDDSQFLCVLSITRLDFEDLKKQQGLLVDFDNFPSQLVRLLQQCASNNMFLIMQQTNPIQFYFEVVEHNEFKRLVHLSLRTGPATDADIKLHMADTIHNLKKIVTALKSSSINSETILNDKCINLERKLHDLTHTVSKMEEDKLRREIDFKESLKQEKERLESERLQWQQSTDIHMKAQLANTQDCLNRKDKQIDELNCVCKQLRDNILQLDNQLSEKSQRLNLLEKEVQKTHIEVATLNAKNVSLERDVTEKEKQCNQQNSRCAYLEKVVRDNSEVIKDLNNSLQATRKEKTSLEERLALSESLAHRNTEAVHSTSEQLLKANQIISKQNADLIEMKEKLLCRTAIALEQEKVIESNIKEMDELTSQIGVTNKKMESLSKELCDLKEKFEINDQALKDRDETIKNNNMVIQWLHKKMEDKCPPNDLLQSKHKLSVQTATSSTPYFLAKSNQTNSSHAVSDDSIDFYATTQLSNIENSPGPAAQGKIGLDPKYLKPASNDNHILNLKAGKSKSQIHQKGKENKTIDNLPNVDYREKKTAKTTFRATPVSAYFP